MDLGVVWCKRLVLPKVPIHYEIFIERETTRDSARDFCSLYFYSHKHQLVQVRDSI